MANDAPSGLPATLGPVLEFMHSLWALEHALSERAKHVRKRFGLTSTERLVIRVLGQSPGTSAGAVARILHILPSTLTPVLQQLVTRGMIRRAADPLDRRRAVLWLTARGERIDAASTSCVDDTVRKSLARIAPSEVFHARRVMSAIAEALGEAPEAATTRRRRTATPLRPPPVARLKPSVATSEAEPKSGAAERRRRSAR